jgi:acetamidase/formamidase
MDMKRGRPQTHWSELASPLPAMAKTGILLYIWPRNKHWARWFTYLIDGRGFTPNQAYVLVSFATDLQISSIVNIPNPVRGSATGRSSNGIEPQ